jgi:hypothetical protein
MSMRIIARSSSNRNCRQRPGELGLADTGGAEEQEAAQRPVRVGEAGARAAHRVGHGLDGLVLADDPPVELLLEPDQLVDLGLDELGDGDAGPAGDHLGDLGLGDLLLREALALLTQLVDAALGGLDRRSSSGRPAVAQLRGALVVAVALGGGGGCSRVCSSSSFAACSLVDDAFSFSHRARIEASRSLEVGELTRRGPRAGRGRTPTPPWPATPARSRAAHAPVHLVDLRRQRVDRDPQSGRGLVEQVDRLVGQEAVGEVAVGQLSRPPRSRRR